MPLNSEKFDNRFVRELPGDPEKSQFTRQVRNACWSEAPPTRVKAPRLVAYSPQVGQLLDLTTDDFKTAAFTDAFSGNQLFPGMQAYAICYGGHQFGNWAGQLGDGRAIGLGEYVNSQGQRWEMQLKGAGPTPYSRTADGRAVLRSSIREFLCSEAMYHLGVPTTRALSLVETGEAVVRDMLYDGNPAPEPGAIVCRVAPSFIRFGNFEILAARGELELLAKLVDFTIDRDFPEIVGDAHAKRSQWFAAVCQRTAHLIAHWMRVGFVHGVMNTDNMSILGLTIDYGPYGWIDNYDPDWTPNTTDAQMHRYAFGRQADIAHWNLARLGSALVPIFPSIEELEAGLKHYTQTLAALDSAYTLTKFGFGLEQGKNVDLCREAFILMHKSEVDMTCFFRSLANVNPDDKDPNIDILRDAFYDDKDGVKIGLKIDKTCDQQWTDWLNRYVGAMREKSVPAATRTTAMNAVNPRYVLRNYLAQEAIDLAEAGDYSRVHELQEILTNPYTENPKFSHFAKKRPDWARARVGCSMLSCSS